MLAFFWVGGNHKRSTEGVTLRDLHIKKFRMLFWCLLYYSGLRRYLGCHVYSVDVYVRVGECAINTVGCF